MESFQSNPMFLVSVYGLFGCLKKEGGRVERERVIQLPYLKVFQGRKGV